MADPRWRWDLGARAERHIHFPLPQCTVSVTEKESVMKTASPLYQKQDVGQFIKSSPHIHVHAPSFHPSQVRSTVPRCWVMKAGLQRDKW